MGSLLSASSILLVIAGVMMFAALPHLTRRSETSIDAEQFASDIVADTENKQPVSVEAQLPEPAPVAPPQFRVKKGRVALFGLSIVALGAALVTALLAPFTAVAWWMPLICALVSFAGLATLRSLALADARRRAAHQAALRGTQSSRGTASRTPRTEGYMNQSGEVLVSRKPSPETRVYRPAPVASSAQSLRYARTHRSTQAPAADTTSEPELEPEHTIFHEQTLKPLSDYQPFEKKMVQTWQPTAVPTPTYLEAEVVHRTVDEVAMTDTTGVRSNSGSLEEAASGKSSFDIEAALKRRRA